MEGRQDERGGAVSEVGDKDIGRIFRGPVREGAAGGGDWFIEGVYFWLIVSTFENK